MMVPRRAKNAWILNAYVLAAVVMLPVQAYAQDVSTSSPHQQGYQCAVSPSDAQNDLVSSGSEDVAPSSTASTTIPGATPSNEMEWLQRGLWASHCYAFQARAVAIDSVGVRTLALSHRIKDGIRQQVVQYLDGPSVSIERRSPGGRLAWIDENSGTDHAPASRWASHLTQHYTLTLEDNARMAGRDAIKLMFEPLDQWRYAHQWWLDRDTGLLLKHVLIDQQGRVIETFQITQLQSPEIYAGTVLVDTLTDIPPTPWSVRWLPGGFVDQPVPQSGDDSHQRVYSDGLATVSIFVEPLSSDTNATLQTGVQQLGVSTAVIDHYTSTEGRWQLVAVGELPVATLQRIARSITFDPPQQGSPGRHDAADNNDPGNSDISSNDANTRDAVSN